MNRRQLLASLATLPLVGPAIASALSRPLDAADCVVGQLPTPIEHGGVDYFAVVYTPAGQCVLGVAMVDIWKGERVVSNADGTLRPYNGGDDRVIGVATNKSANGRVEIVLI